MRKIKLAKIGMTLVAGVFSVCLLGQSVGSLTAGAGASKVYLISNSSVSGTTINEGDLLVDGGVYAEEGKLVFDENCGKSAKVLAKTKLNNYKKYGVSTLLDFDATFNFEKLAEGGEVSIAVGMQKSNDNAGGKDSVEISFTYDNGIHIAVNEYAEKDVAKVVMKDYAYPALSLNEDLAVSLDIDVYGKTYLTVGGLDVVKGKYLTVDPTGYLAFFSYAGASEKNVFTISDVTVTGYTYDVVETVAYYKEDFDKGSYNANMFYSMANASSLPDSGIYVKDNALMFRNVSQGYFGTREKFANFELKFDLVDLQRTPEYDEEGNLAELISHWFMLGFGVDNYNDPPSERTLATYLQIESLTGTSTARPIDHELGTPRNDRFVLYNDAITGASTNIQSFTAQPDSYSLWDAEKIGDKTVSVKFTVIDGVIELFYKIEGETDYTKVYSYDLGITQVGYVRIYTYGQSAPDSMGFKYTGTLNMTIDNLEITNLDNETVKIIKSAPAYRSNITPAVKDFEYKTVTDDSDLLINKLKKGDK